MAARLRLTPSEAQELLVLRRFPRRTRQLMRAVIFHTAEVHGWVPHGKAGAPVRTFLSRYDRLTGRRTRNLGVLRAR